MFYHNNTFQNPCINRKTTLVENLQGETASMKYFLGGESAGMETNLQGEWAEMEKNLQSEPAGTEQSPKIPSR